jgi:hypothetical protein
MENEIVSIIVLVLSVGQWVSEVGDFQSAYSQQSIDFYHVRIFSLFFWNMPRRFPSCVCLCSPPNDFWMPEEIFMKLGMYWYIMAAEPISTGYFINPFHQSVSVCVSLLSLQGNGSVKCIPPFGARQRLGKHVSAATNTCNNRSIVERVIFCVSVVLSVYPHIVAR